MPSFVNMLSCKLHVLRTSCTASKHRAVEHLWQATFAEYGVIRQQHSQFCCVEQVKLVSLQTDKRKMQARAKLGEMLASGLQALVMDTAALSRQSKGLDSQLANIKHLSEKTSGQLVRSAWVFSNALGIPSPLSDNAADR